MFELAVRCVAEAAGTEYSCFDRTGAAGVMRMAPEGIVIPKFLELRISRLESLLVRIVLCKCHHVLCNLM